MSEQANQLYPDEATYAAAVDDELPSSQALVFDEEDDEQPEEEMEEEEEEIEEELVIEPPPKRVATRAAAPGAVSQAATVDRLEKSLMNSGPAFRRAVTANVARRGVGRGGGRAVVGQRHKNPVAAKKKVVMPPPTSPPPPSKEPKHINLGNDADKTWSTDGDRLLTEITLNNYSTMLVYRQIYGTDRLVVRLVKKYMKNREERSFSMDIPADEFEKLQEAWAMIRAEADYKKCMKQ